MNKLSIIFPAILLLFLFSCKNKTTEIKPISIIPQPVSIAQQEGYFTIDKNTRIIYAIDKDASVIAEYLKDILQESTGFEIATGSSKNEKNIIIIYLTNKVELGDEGYELKVIKDKIILSANNTNGLFYGVQSLLQLLPAEIFNQERVEDVKWTIPCCNIVDQPRFPWRGMHLDVSRHFFSVEFVKRYIDLIAMHKMNIFHWHLTDDNGWRIEIKKYPLLTEVAAWRVDREDMNWREVTQPEPGEEATYGGFYTQDEIRDVVAYAAKRQITVIPEIEMPGHTSEVFAAYPELSCRGEKLYVQPGSYWPNTDIFCAGNDEVFTFLENVLDEVMELFPSKYIHIGGDEATKQEWEKCPKCQDRIKSEGLKNEHELQSYFIKRIEKYINSKGKLLIGWDEILEGGLAPEATVMSWRGFQGGIDAATQGHDVIMCPTSHCYFDYYQANPDFEPLAIGGFTSLKKVYFFDPIPEELNEVQSRHILGGQGNVWTEYIQTPEHAEYMAVPRMTALSEVLWSDKEDQNWESFQLRLQDQLRRFDQMNINYSKGSWKVDIFPVMEDGKYKVTDICNNLMISQSEVSESLNRSKIARLIGSDKFVYRKSLYEFLIYGLRVVFPVIPGAIARGVPTSHSAPPLSAEIVAGNENYVWQYAKGEIRGMIIEPLYKTVPKVCLKLPELHELLSLLDALRIGRIREINIAKNILKERLIDNA